MAFDDPFALANPFGDPFGLGPTPQQQLRPAPAVPKLNPQEEESLFSKIGSGALHGLGWIGGLLDKTFGGRAIRAGVNMGLGGNTPASELLSFIPGSDTLGITNPENSVSGAEILGGSKDTPLLSGEGLGGLALELALDPSTYLTFGGQALTGLGKTAAKAGIKPVSGAARAAGLLGPEAEQLARYMTLGAKEGPVSSKAIADVASKSLGGHIGIGLPFAGNLATFDLTKPLDAAGAAFNAIPGSSLVSSAANKAAEITAPLRQGFSSLFDANVKGQIDPVLQEAARGVSGATKEAVYANLGKMTGLTEEMQRLAGHQQGMPWTPQLQANANQIGKEFRLALERTPTPLSDATKAIVAQTPANVQQAILAGQTANIPAEVVDAIKAAKEYADVTAQHAPALSNVRPEVLDLAQRARTMLDEQLALERQAGFLTQPLKKPGVAGPEYATRAGVQFEGGPKGNIRATQLPPEEVARRDALLANLFTEGEGSINWLTGTPEGKAIQQMPIEQAQEEILKRMLGWNPALLNEYVDLSNRKSLQTLGDAGERRLTELLNKYTTNKLPMPEGELFHTLSYKSPINSVNDALNVLQGGSMRPIDTWADTVTSAGKSAAADRWNANAAQGTVSMVFDRPTIEQAGGTIQERTGIAKVFNPNAPKYDPALKQVVFKGDASSAEFGKLQQAVNDLNAKRKSFGLNPVELMTADQKMAPKFGLGNIETGELQTLLKKKATAITPEELSRLNELEKVREQARGLADWQRGLDLGALEQTGGFFGNHPLADMERYLESRAVNRLNAGAAYEAIPKLATIESAGAVPVGKLMENLGLDISKLPAGVAQAYVPEAQAKALTNWIRPTVAPEGARPWLDWIDSITNLTKAGQTSWPATQMRNVISDTFNRFAYGGSPITPLAEAKTFREGGIIPGIAKKIGMEGVSDAEATKQLAREMYQLGLMDTKKFQAMDVAGVNPLRETQAKGMPLIGVPPAGLKEAIGKNIPGIGAEATWAQAINPLETRGVGGRAESKFLPVAAMQSAQNYAEEMNRIATYLDARSRGFEPLAALGEVTKAHLDFSNLSPFERNVMRRVMPFYSWARQNTPNIIQELATNPGGRMAQTMRLLNAGTDQGFLPENVTQTGYAVPVGQDESGKQNYLTSLGLPFEDLANLTSLRNLMGSTNPFIRLPYELATGRQAYTGQNVPATFPFEGNPTLNAIAMNSPLSRVFSMYRSAGRGIEGGQYWPLALQALAGPRVTNVDPLAARRAAVRQLAEERLGALPEISNFQNLSVKPGQAQNLTPEELQLLQLYNAVNRRQTAAQVAR